MNPKNNIINLSDFTSSSHPFGSIQGKKVFRELSDYIDSNPEISIFGISLNGIEITDVSFPRESVISIAKLYRGEKWFYLLDVNNRDLVDNWASAAQIKEQPLVIWDNKNFEFIGSNLKGSTQPLITYIYERKRVTTSQVAHDLKISAQNASAKLKKFFNQGFLIRTEESSESGGKEFIYEAIAEF